MTQKDNLDHRALWILDRTDMNFLLIINSDTDFSLNIDYVVHIVHLSF